MRLSFGKWIMILICVVALGGLIFVDSMDEIDRTEIELSFVLGEEIIDAWKGEDGYYLFLPSYAQLEQLKLQSYATEFEILDKEIVVMRGGTLAGLPLGEVLMCKTAATKEEFTLCLLKSAELPTVFIETDSGTLDAVWADKSVEENGKMQVLDENGLLIYRGGLKSIKGRGNYSYAHFQKKSMTFTLKEEASILELGSGSRYALIANASDPTLIRNEIARKMEAELETEYTNEGRFVDLYANGEYFGNYYLCEMIEVGTDRIQVTDLEAKMEMLYQKANYASFTDYETENKKAKVLDYNPDDITGGYLVEREYETRYLEEYAENPSGFVTDGGEHFVVKSPMYCSDEQIDYLKNFFDKAETAMLSENGLHPETGVSYDEYIDVDSFVKKYLVEEVTKNYDAGVSSSYFYKDSDSIDGRLKAAPIWDCDMSLGSYLEWMDYFSEDPKGISALSLHGHASFWYEVLYDKPEVYEKICAYYEEKVVPYLDSLLEEKIDEYEEYLSASAYMNNIRWKVDLDNNPYYNDRESSFKELKEYIAQRKTFLDEAWIEQIPYHIVTFEKDGGILEIRHIREGEELGELPAMEDEDFNGWIYVKNKKPVQESDVIVGDTEITCTLETIGTK